MTHRRTPAPRVVPEALARDLCANLAPIERATMALIVQGYTSKEIAIRRGRALKTVERTRAMAIEKLGALNIAHAAVIAAKGGLA